MTITEYQNAAARTINPQLRTDDMQYHALHGLCAEVGEIHGLFQKYFQGHDFTEKDLQKEVGDLAWFIAELCTANRWSMDAVLQANIEKLMRRYPDGFSEERSLHRTE